MFLYAYDQTDKPLSKEHLYRQGPPSKEVFHVMCGASGAGELS